MKEHVITVYLLKCLIHFGIVVTKYLIFLQAVRDSKFLLVEVP